MHQRKSKKILTYFFLLLLVGSINNIHLNSVKLQSIQDIKVLGLDNKENSILKEKIKDLKLNNFFSIKTKEINNIISSNNLVEKYRIFKRYPSSLDINIDQTKFLARINDNGKTFLVGSNSKLSEAYLSNDTLPFIFGNPNIKEFLDFKKIIDQSKFSYDDIKNLYFFSSKRWDLELNNGVIIKLPQNYIEDSLRLVFEFLYQQKFENIKIIDARIKNQIILND